MKISCAHRVKIFGIAARSEEIALLLLRAFRRWAFSFPSLFLLLRLRRRLCAQEMSLAKKTNFFVATARKCFPAYFNFFSDTYCGLENLLPQPNPFIFTPANLNTSPPSFIGKVWLLLNLNYIKEGANSLYCENELIFLTAYNF